MKAVKAHYKDGQVTLMESPPIAREAEVLVVFPDAPWQRAAGMGLPFEELHDLVGILNIGGDAVQESDDIYDR